MSPSPQLHWLAGVHAGCFDAAGALLRRQPLAEPALADALAEPVERLRLALLGEMVPAATFFRHLVPLAAGTDSTYELADVALVKTIGRTEAEARLGLFRGLLTDLRVAYERALPGLDALLAERGRELQQRWTRRGPALLPGVANWTGPGVLPDEATVVLVYPARGGGGTAYLPYRLACLELTAEEPVPELPEVVRLAWLAAQLNLGVPRFSESVRRNPLPVVAGLAMVPVVLAAAEAAEVARCDAATMDLAVRSWLRPGEAEADGWSAVVGEWWEVYRTMRPRWPTALQALDKLLATRDNRPGDREDRDRTPLTPALSLPEAGE